ncbi:MAG TPA: RsmD family RNA methyltransferase, partial [Dermatophilaceae bacterium]|nr:RsmD family RNA methyltransferase [Dermatophilaceae bacterium]
MTRIISGLVGGRRLATPAGVSTRPTSDRVREALFSRLEHQEVLQGARVLDLYAGSGALGLEALSRGAARATLIDSDKGAARVARLNAQALGFGDVVTVRAEPVERALLTGPDLADGRADLAFLDPPYDLVEDRLVDVLALLVHQRWL